VTYAHKSSIQLIVGYVNGFGNKKQNIFAKGKGVNE
jgi:hypothetical protein